MRESVLSVSWSCVPVACSAGTRPTGHSHEEDQGAGVQHPRAVDRDRLRHRQPLRIQRHETCEEPLREHDTGETAGNRQEHRLADQLPDQAPAVRAERVSHGELPPPGFPVRNQQPRDVDADDQQDERHRATEQHPRVAVIANDVFLQRAADGEVPVGVMSRIGG